MKKIIVFIFLGFFFLGTALKISDSRNSTRALNTNFNPVLKITGIEKLYAANEDQWDSVRNIISFTRNITKSINDLMANLESTGLFNVSGTFTTNNGTFKIKLVMNQEETITDNSTGSNLTFSNKLILWNASNNAKYLEIYFDDPTTKTGGDGALVTFEPAVIDPTTYTAGKRMECYSNGQTMTCSWEGMIASHNIDRGQLIAQMNSDNTIQLRLLAKTTLTSITGLGNCSTGVYYYTLGAIIQNSDPFYTTSAFGIKCNEESYELGSSANPYNYGYFNANANPTASDSTKYFAGMGSTPPSSDYPSTTDVNNLISLDPTKTQVDSIPTINFKSTDSAP